MKFIAVINQDGGSAKSIDMKDFSTFLHQVFKEKQHAIDIHVVKGESLMEELRSCFAKDDADAVIVCGGDGTISAAARLAFKHDKVLGIIPAGTFNLFARSLQIPLDLYEAAEYLSKSEVQRCDIATVNGQTFVHQYSIGIQPQMIEERDQTEYSGQIGKILNAAAATVNVLSDHKQYKLSIFGIDLEGRQVKYDNVDVSFLAAANNRYGSDHLPYADNLNGGEIAAYWSKPLSLAQGVEITSDLLTGRWEDNQQLVFKPFKTLNIAIHNIDKNDHASIDGELVPLESALEIEIHPKALRILTRK